MKIGIFTDSYLPTVNGVTTSVVCTAEELQKRGHDVIIVAPSFPHYQDKPGRIIRLRSVSLPGHEVLRVATYLPGTSFVMASRLDLDIIHGHSGGSVSWLGWEVSTIKRIPYVFTYHTLFNQYTHYFLRGKVVRPGMIDAATRVFGNMTDRVIAPTHKIERELLKYGVKKPIDILPSGIDLDLFKPLPKQSLRKELRIPQDEIIFMYAGRLGKEKSVDMIIRAFGLTLKKCPKARLIIAGDGPDRQKLETLARKVAPHKVHFLGFVQRPDLPATYSGADVFVFASITETQGLVVPEAMACGLPIVAVDDPVYEGLLADKHDALLTQHSQVSLSQAMIKLAQSPDERRRLSKRSLAQAQTLSLDGMTDNLLEIYQQLIDHPTTHDFMTLPPWLRMEWRDKQTI